jgi:hypothetical protein
MMPNKTIYVADADMPIFERAQQLAGSNLSATIAQALRRFIAVEEAKMIGFQEITVRVGDKGTYTQKRFLGRPLAKRHVRDSQNRTTTLTVFQTAKGNFALYTRMAPDWSAWSDPALWSNWNWDVDVNVDVDVDPGAPHRPPRPPSPPRPPRPPRPGWSGWADWAAGWAQGGEYRLEVFATLEEMRERIPPELYDAAQQALRGPEIEDLDI